MAEEKFYCLFDKLIKLTIINKMVTKIYSNIQIPYMSDFIVSFVGLPLSGKSSIINSVVIKNLLQSRIYRTTADFKLIDEDIFDDNNNKFKVYVLPGICDSEEKDNNKFNDLTYLYIKDSNLIIWTSDINKAFVTTYEVNEYNKLKKYIKDLSDTSGKLYYVIIMLSKCDKDSDKDTDIIDIINNVKKIFPDEDIILYNAYGRSYHNNKTTYELKKFIEEKIGVPTKSNIFIKNTNGVPSKFNILFDISKYILNFSDKQEKLYFDKFIYCYDEIITTNINDLDNDHGGSYADMIISIWIKLTKNQQLNHLIKISDDNFDDKIYNN